ncbi:hypothetical protein GCM10023257_10770 [Streptomyces hyderabadensis]|uniref:Uncharacterized protein n=1 Tax=Streptomyces hyderabadensis TaxID=598549 RepID=A0ABP9HPN2_9ACTN
MPGGGAAGEIEGATAGLSAVAEPAEAAVIPTASAEAPVTVTTERREGVLPRGAGGRSGVPWSPEAGCSSPAAGGFFPNGVFALVVFAF